MVVGIAAHIADSNRDAVSRTNNTQLRDRILLEKLVYELGCVRESEEVSSGSEIFLVHR